MKVELIRTLSGPESPESAALYQAAEKVFLIPEYGDVVKALEGGYVPLQKFVEWNEEFHQGTPFTGPDVYIRQGDRGVFIHTNNGREIFVTHEGVIINFIRDGEGSTIAAGEVIAHIWASDPGDRLQGIMVRCDDGDVDINDYNGPVHPQLSRTCYDTDFKTRFEAGEETWLTCLHRQEAKKNDLVKVAQAFLRRKATISELRAAVRKCEQN